MIVLLRFSLDVCEETGFFQHVLFHLEDHHKTPSDIQVAAKCFSGLLSTLVYMNFLSGRPPGGGNGSLLQYSCLENSMDRGAWGTTVHRVPKSQTRLKWLSTHAHMYMHIHTQEQLNKKNKLLTCINTMHSILCLICYILFYFYKL